MNLLITCPQWLSSVLTSELKRLGMKPYDTFPHGTYVQTDMRGMMLANLRLRSASKVFLLVNESTISNLDELFDETKAIERGHGIKETDTIRVTVTSSHPQLISPKTMQSVAHAAIVQWANCRSDFTEENVKEIYIQCTPSHCRRYINTSGDSLHKRGYRTQTSDAPLSETLAAWLILQSGWKSHIPLRDPCCGSGTICIEAALIARNIAPWLQRSFAFQSFPIYRADLREDIIADANNKQYHKTYAIHGSDIDPTVIAIAQANAQRAGVADCIHFEISPLEKGGRVHQTQEVLLHQTESLTPFNKGGLGGLFLITNPPYGQRIGQDANLEELYTTLLSFYEQWAKGAYITTYRHDIPDSLRSHLKTRQVMNGGMECTMYFVH